eukprot:1997636-Amphidinium_carterae.1
MELRIVIPRKAPHPNESLGVAPRRAALELCVCVEGSSVVSMCGVMHEVMRKEESQASGLGNICSLRRNSSLRRESTASRQSVQLKRMKSTSIKNLPVGETPRFSDALKNLDETLECEEQKPALGRRVVLEGCSLVGRVVKSTKFDLFFSLLILLNACAFALQVQLEGWDKGSKEGYTSADHAYKDDPSWSVVLLVLQATGNVIGAFFLFEVVVK